MHLTKTVNNWYIGPNATVYNCLDSAMSSFMRSSELIACTSFYFEDTVSLVKNDNIYYLYREFDPVEDSLYGNFYTSSKLEKLTHDELISAFQENDWFDEFEKLFPLDYKNIMGEF